VIDLNRSKTTIRELAFAEQYLKTNKKRAPHHYQIGCPYLSRNENLSYGDIYSGRTFLSLLNVKCNSITFIE